MADKKKFGLIMPKRAEGLKIKRNSIFNDDSDEEERIKKRPKIPQKKIELNSKKKTESVEDPSIYEYDNIYDEMKLKQAEIIAPKEKKNSRYIDTLMKAAENRKKQYERRIDKKIQAEREKEGDKYKDKEAFVTSSYKKKMLEQEEEEEKERRENMLNDMMDVTKQKDLSGFYRHFLKQTIGEEKVPVFGEKQIKKEIVSDEDDEGKSSHKCDEISKDYKNIDQDSDGVEIDDDENQSSGKSDIEDPRKKSSNKSFPKYSKTNILSEQSSDSENQGSKSRESISDSGKSQTFQSHKHIRTHYRKSNISPNSSDDENNLPTEERQSSKHKNSLKNSKKLLHNRKSNESSNTSHDDNDNDEENNPSTEKRHSSKYKKSDKKNKKRLHKCRHDSDFTSSDDSVKINKETADTDDNKSTNEKKSRKNIYVKRTVGDVFAEAQARYFQRIALRNG